MSTKYKVGDKVTVRRDLSLHRRYSNYNSPMHDDVAVGNMFNYRGKQITVEEISRNLKYVCKECPSYFWTDEMFEEFTIKEEDTYRYEEDETVISFSKPADLLSLYGGK